jgi:hypothetical protein
MASYGRDTQSMGSQLAPVGQNPIVAAVDGSCQWLVHRCWFAAWRSRAVVLTLQDDRLHTSGCMERLLWAHASAAPQVLSTLAQDLLNVEHWPYTALGSAATSTMAMLELALAQQAVATLPPGSLLLLDGALCPHQVAEQRAVLALAAQRGVGVVGVRKESHNLDPALALADAERAVCAVHPLAAPTAGWDVTTVQAHLAPTAQASFVLDVSHHALAMATTLLELCSHCGHVGYPALLDSAHARVRYPASSHTEGHRQLRAAWQRAGLQLAVLDALTLGYGHRPGSTAQGRARP